VAPFSTFIYSVTRRTKTLMCHNSFQICRSDQWVEELFWERGNSFGTNLGDRRAKKIIKKLLRNERILRELPPRRRLSKSLSKIGSIHSPYNLPARPSDAHSDGLVVFRENFSPGSKKSLTNGEKYGKILFRAYVCSNCHSREFRNIDVRALCNKTP